MFEFFIFAFSAFALLHLHKLVDYTTVKGYKYLDVIFEKSVTDNEGGGGYYRVNEEFRY